MRRTMMLPPSELYTDVCLGRLIDQLHEVGPDVRYTSSRHCLSEGYFTKQQNLAYITKVTSACRLQTLPRSPA